MRNKIAVARCLLLTGIFAAVLSCIEADGACRAGRTPGAGSPDGPAADGSPGRKISRGSSRWMESPSSLFWQPRSTASHGGVEFPPRVPRDAGVSRKGFSSTVPGLRIDLTERRCVAQFRGTGGTCC